MTCNWKTSEQWLCTFSSYLRDQGCDLHVITRVLYCKLNVPLKAGEASCTMVVVRVTPFDSDTTSEPTLNRKQSSVHQHKNQHYNLTLYLWQECRDHKLQALFNILSHETGALQINVIIIIIINISMSESVLACWRIHLLCAQNFNLDTQKFSQTCNCYQKNISL